MNKWLVNDQIMKEETSSDLLKDTIATKTDDSYL